MGVNDFHTRALRWPARRILHLQAISPIDEVLGAAVIRVLSVQICRILCRPAGKDSVQEMKVGNVTTTIRKRKCHVVGIGMVASSQRAANAMEPTAGSLPINVDGGAVANKDVVGGSKQVGRSFQSEGPCFGRS